MARRSAERGGGLGLAISLLVLVGLAIYLVVGREPKPDPNYVAAREMVDSYQSVRTTSQYNYLDPVYDRVLAKLKKVDPDSVSAPDAATLGSEIRDGRLAYRERLDSQRRAAEEQRETRRSRHQDLQYRQEYVHGGTDGDAARRQREQGATKSCDDEGGDHSGHDHD